MKEIIPNVLNGLPAVKEVKFIAYDSTMCAVWHSDDEKK